VRPDARISLGITCMYTRPRLDQQCRLSWYILGSYVSMMTHSVIWTSFQAPPVLGESDLSTHTMQAGVSARHERRRSWISAITLDSARHQTQRMIVQICIRVCLINSRALPRWKTCAGSVCRPSVLSTRSNFRCAWQGGTRAWQTCE